MDACLQISNYLNNTIKIFMDVKWLINYTQNVLTNQAYVYIVLLNVSGWKGLLKTEMPVFSFLVILYSFNDY